MELAPGSILLGKYRVEEILGTGGMGRVVRASHQYLAQSVAIKILLPQMAESPSTVARFLREAQATVKLKNEHVARVIDVGTMPDGTPFMVMEYLEGNDLNQILRHHGPQPPAVVVDLMLQACEGIAEAHALGIIHRDIKPSNFFITRKPDGSMLLKILDFGISKTPVGFEELTGTQTVIGTPSYMAPEQMKSGRHADARSDIWSMGVVMYQLLQGRPPFQGESYAELVLKVGADPPTPFHVPLPPGLREVIFKSLEKDPKNRQQNVGELARMLAPFSSDPVTAAQIASRTARILQHQAGGGVQGLPIASGGGLATPVPISPAQLTPRSWPPSTSQSLGRGQQTMPVRSSNRWLIAGAFSLAMLAAAGGYIASELMQKKSEPAAASATSGDAKTVQMPAPTPPAPTAPPATPPPAAAKVETPAPPATPPKEEVPASSNWKPQTVQPTIVPKTDVPKTDVPKTDVPKTDVPKTVTPAKTETAAPAKTVTKAVTKTADAPPTKPATKTTTKAPAKPPTKTATKAPTKTPTKTPTKPPTKTDTKKTDLFDTRK